MSGSGKNRRPCPEGFAAARLAKATAFMDAAELTSTFDDTQELRDASVTLARNECADSGRSRVANGNPHRNNRPLLPLVGSHWRGTVSEPVPRRSYDLSGYLAS